MIWLWIAAALISGALAVLVVQRSVRAVTAPRSDNPALAVYRRQMAELDELAERGVLADAERRSVRAEAGRRLLAAAGRAEAPLRHAKPGQILLLTACVPLVALVAYFVLGAPDYPDQPFKARLAAWRNADPQMLAAPQMAAILRAIAAERPADPEPLRQLALAEFASREPTEAIQALHRAIALAPRRADLQEMLGLALTAQNGGEPDADALDAFHQALVLDPTNVTARYYLARARIGAGDTAGGVADWSALQATLGPGDPRRQELAQQIQQVTATGRLPSAQPAQDQPVGTPQIQAMVDGLAARLRTNPDDPAGWVRLVRAYTVLGELDRRDQVLAIARRRYAGRPDILAQLETAQARSPQPNAAMSPPAGSP
ncbi:MAG: c-type cytochrome biogenesis protein CcmI [Caulobacteraceae bacterium]